MKGFVFALGVSLILCVPSWALLENRPLNADDPGVAPKGSINGTFGIDYAKPRTGDAQSQPVVVVTYGLGENFDLGVSIPYLFLSGASGVGDISVGSSIRILEEGKTLPATNLALIYKSTTGDAGRSLGSGTASQTIELILGKNLWNTTYYFNLATTLAQGSQNPWNLNLAFDREITGTFHSVGELVLTLMLGNPGSAEVLLGGVYALDGATALDVGLDFGLSESTSAHKITMGISRNI